MPYGMAESHGTTVEAGALIDPLSCNTVLLDKFTDNTERLSCKCLVKFYKSPYPEVSYLLS